MLACLLASSMSLPAVVAAPKTKVIADKKKEIASPVMTGDAVAGKFKSENERCQECHGSEGQGDGIGAEGKFAKLAGQSPEYIVKQVQDFRSGARQHDFMSMMAKSIDDADLIDIAAYFGSQKRMQGDGSGDDKIGKNLFVSGDASRNILPCISCHGVGNNGTAANPLIAGQQWRYLEKQLLDWRSGERHNSADGVMNKVAKLLSDNEITALANYISGLQ